MKASEAPENNKRKAPDKIYACFGVFGLIQAMEIRATSEDIEYTRTDAFVEKAAKWLEDNAIEYWGTEAVDNGMMIDDFKKAMKL